MATQTTNYHLIKPEYGDPADINVLNGNMDALDSELKLQSDHIDEVEEEFHTFKPSGNGTADQILRSNGDGTTRWDNAATQQEVGAAVTAWLDANIDTEHTVVVDPTLSVEHAAADAKKTGDKITDLKSAIKSKSSAWANVGLASATGLPSTSTIRAATLFIDRRIEQVIPASGAKCAVFCWDTTGEYIGVYTGSGYSKSGITWHESAVDLTAVNSAYQIRVLAAYVAANATITPENAADLIMFKYDTLNIANDIEGIYIQLSDIAVRHVNIMDGMTPRTGYYYNGLTQQANADFNAYQLIPIKAGVTYYYMSIYGALSTVRCDYDNTASALPGDSGTLTPTYDSYLAITTTAPQKPLLTTDQEMYDSAQKSTYYVSNKLFVKEDNLIGIEKNNLLSGTNSWSGEWNNDSFWTTDSETFRGLTVKKRTAAWNGLYKPVTIEAGKHYHFNAWVKLSEAKAIQVALVNSALGSTATVYIERVSTTVLTENYSIPARANAAGKWRKINIEFDCATSGLIHPLVQLTDSGATIFVCGYSVAEGRNTEKNVYYCDKDGHRDFSKICEAVEWATQYYDSTVYVGAGEWDIVDEFGSTYMENTQESYNNGNLLCNRIHMIFSSDADVIAHYTGTNNATMLNFSPFNSGIYGFTLENLHINCSKVRYCVHDERQTNSDQYTNKYIDCKMYLDNTNNTGTNTFQCIGGGLGTNGHIMIEGGDYQAVNPTYKPSSGYTPISYHNSWGSGKSRIDISGVYIHDGSIRLNWFGPSTEITECYVHGCSFTHAIVSGKETQDTSPNENIRVVEWNNEIRQAS